MSEAVLAVPVSRLFGQPVGVAEPSEAVRQQEALELAFEEGRAAAVAELGGRIAELEAEGAALRETHAAAGEAAARASAAAFAALEAALADGVAALGLAVARAALGAEPKLEAVTIRQLVSDALAGLPEGAAGSLRMHPDDAAHAPDLPSGWVVVADAALGPGHVLAERGSSLSAAGLYQRLEQLRARLEDGE
jgi:flagellar biosynthesis/type III secretory pathway protein FliH